MASVMCYLVMNFQVEKLNTDGSSISASPLNVMQTLSTFQIFVTVCFITLSSLLVRHGVVARFVATDGGITRVYPKRYLSSSCRKGVDLEAWEGVDSMFRII